MQKNIRGKYFFTALENGTTFTPACAAIGKQSTMGWCDADRRKIRKNVTIHPCTSGVCVVLAPRQTKEMVQKRNQQLCIISCGQLNPPWRNRKKATDWRGTKPLNISDELLIE